MANESGALSTLQSKKWRELSTFVFLQTLSYHHVKVLFYGADLRAPSIEAPLNFREQLHTDHTAKGKDQYTNEYFISLKCGASDSDHEPDSSRGGVELSDEDPDEGATDRQAQAS